MLAVIVFYLLFTSKKDTKYTVFLLKYLHARLLIPHHGSDFFFQDLPLISVKEAKTRDGAIFLQLTVSSRTNMRETFWNFLDRFGCHYGGTFCRPLLPYEVKEFMFFAHIKCTGIF